MGECRRCTTNPARQKGKLGSHLHRTAAVSGGLTPLPPRALPVLLIVVADGDSVMLPLMPPMLLLLLDSEVR